MAEQERDERGRFGSGGGTEDSRKEALAKEVSKEADDHSAWLDKVKSGSRDEHSLGARLHDNAARANAQAGNRKEYDRHKAMADKHAADAGKIKAGEINQWAKSRSPFPSRTGR